MIYLDLGAALAAYGLIFAVYQLRRESWAVVLRIRGWWERNLIWLLVMLGLVLTLIAVLLDHKPPPPSLRSTLESPLTYDIAAYICFILSPLSLLYFSRSVPFTKRNARRFYHILTLEISRTGDENVTAALAVILPNFRQICHVATRKDIYGDASAFANSILDVILSDETVVGILTTKRLDALLHIFATIANTDLTRDSASVGVGALVQGLLTNSHSYLYKHLNRRGLALSSDLYKVVFESSTLLSNFDFFDWPTIDFTFAKKLDNRGVEVYIAALSRSIKTYLESGLVPPQTLNRGLFHLANIFDRLCNDIRTKEGAHESYAEGNWWALHQIAQFLGHDYLFLATDRNGNDLSVVSDIEQQTDKADFYSRTSLNAGIAAILYRAFASLAEIKDESGTYQIATELVSGMIFNADLKAGYRNAFLSRLWEQIGQNVGRRWYPAPLRAYLLVIGYFLMAGLNNLPNWLGEEMERVRRLLYVDLKPLIVAEAEMADHTRLRNALLPEMLRYEGDRFAFRTGSGAWIEITPPPEGAPSALVGIDLDKIPNPLR